MSPKIKVDNIDLYFKSRYDYFFYDHANAKMLFLMGCRPAEFLNLGTTSIDLINSTITFTQVKEGLTTVRSIGPDYLKFIYDLWSAYGSPRTYYNSYSTLLNYLKRVRVPKYQISTRLNDLYAFRYCACASLLNQGYSESDIIKFFNHKNPANTAYYINQGISINLQLTDQKE